MTASEWDEVIEEQQLRLTRHLICAIEARGIISSPRRNARHRLDIFSQLLDDRDPSRDGKILETSTGTYMPTRSSEIMGGMPVEIVDEFEDATWELCEEPVCRILEVPFTPLRKKA